MTESQGQSPNEANLLFLMSEVSRLARQRLQERAHSGCLPQGQWRVLLKLARHEGINQVTLAELLEVKPISVARMLDRLQALGLVERRADPEDRRVFRIYLTPQAAPIIDRTRSFMREVREEALQGVAPELRAQFLECLQVMHDNLSTGEPADAGAPHATLHSNGHGN